MKNPHENPTKSKSKSLIKRSRGSSQHNGKSGGMGERSKRTAARRPHQLDKQRTNPGIFPTRLCICMNNTMTVATNNYHYRNFRLHADKQMPRLHHNYSATTTQS